MDGFDRNTAVSCVIYDCDGVIFDSLDANQRLYNRIAEGVGREPLTSGELMYCHTHTVFESLHYMFRDEPFLEARAVEFLKDRVDFRDFIVYLKMEPNLLEALAELRRRGVSTAISTNRTTSMKHVMERFNLWPYFDMVVTALDVEKPKPAPESVEKILAALKVDRDKVLFIGDSEVDSETARSSGVRFIAYKNRELLSGDPSCGYIEDHLKLLEFLRSEASPQGPFCP
jgi:phosphoglycolate phosphatase